MDFHPDDWNDVIVYVIVGLPAILGAVAAFRHQNKTLGKQTAIAEKMLYEVKNDHRSNLRDDIDALAAQISDGFKNIHTDIHGLREELRTERIERIEGDKRRLL